MLLFSLLGVILLFAFIFLFFMKSKEHDEFVALFLQLKTLSEVTDFFSDIFTPSEVAKIVERWQIFKLLHSGMSQREVQRELGVGIMTVTRGAKALREASGVLRKILG
jgi:TrpR family transcriptional regulator, trp operon repressor